MPDKDQSFWTSYSDLSTGLMMVFLLLTTIFVLLRLQMEEEKRADVDQFVEQVSRLTTVRLHLASELSKELKAAEDDYGWEEGDVKVDMVTARVTVAHDALGFDSGRLEPNNPEFLRQFAKPYACALIHFEESQSGVGFQKLDPRESKAVKRILVTGHADLEWDPADGPAFLNNRRISAARAKNVIDQAFGFVRGEKCGEREIEPYLQMRFQPAAAGEIGHCIEARYGDSSQLCSTLMGDDRSKNPEHRTVTFEVELVGEDPSGMALNLVALDAKMSGTALPDDFLDRLEPMLEGCVTTKRPDAECWPILPESGILELDAELNRKVQSACAAAWKRKEIEPEENEVSERYCPKS